MPFSERTNWPLEESAWAKAAAAAGRSGAIDLTESNPTRCAFRYPETLLRPFSNPANLKYEPDSRGFAQARSAVSAYYAKKGVRIPAENVVLAAGTSEAYSFLFKLLVDSGKTVLVPEPGYPLLDHLAQLSDVKIGRYPLIYSENGGWALDRERLQKLLTADIRALVIVHPNNPTGHFTHEEDRLWLEAQAAERDFALIADEVFLDYPFDPALKLPTFAGNRQALTFTLSGVSKILGLPQMKLSWIAASGPAALADEALSRLSIIADAFLTVSGPPQRALESWLSGRDEIIAEIGNRVRQNRALLGKSLPLLRADGGWHSVIRYDRPETDEEMSLKLMEEGVLVQPGYLFDLPEHHLVVSLLPEPSVFKEGVRRLSYLV